MPLYMDIHTVDPATPWEDVANAHMSDVRIQHDYDVDYLKYWFNRDCGKLFCLVDAPSKEAAHCVHREAHGLLAEKLIEVDPDLLDSFMGAAGVNSGGAALLPGASSETQRDSGVRTVMFTDIVDSTEMCSRHGDDAAMAMLGVHDRIVRDALGANGGREVKHTGDGIMAAFLSAVGAVRSACAVQAALRDHNSNGTDLPVVVRIGISAGEPIEKSEDLFGSTVQLAARLCGQADPGQILVSQVIADLCIGKNFKFYDTGACQLKGFAEPIATRGVEIVC
ncbi:MAG TPA: nickel-binding protein [Sphingomicrobium sp.]|nr:nickel-binding protein [Sphingomicrobium sp.]